MQDVIDDDRERDERERCPEQLPRHARTLAAPSPRSGFCQVLRRVRSVTQNPGMETERDLATRPSELPLHPQDEIECRRCGVHCDKVVYPAACAARGCQFLYSYEEFGHTYVGCMQRVFAVEIDFDLLQAAET